MEQPLPMDLIAEILVLLPVKSILRFRCVCKSWNALISEPHFVNKHRLTSAADPKRHHVMVAYPPFEYTPLPGCPVKLLKDFLLPSLLHSSSTSPISSQFEVPAPCDALNQEHGFSIIGSYHGILCLRISQTRGLVLWNPSVRSFRLLPPITWPHQGVLKGWGFGYDHSSQTYKVVSVLFYDYSLDGGYDTHVVMLANDSWRPIPKFPGTPLVNISNIHGKFASGTFNWLCSYSLSSAIVSLDPVTERYRQLLIPDCLLLRIHGLELYELKDCLCIFALHEINSNIRSMYAEVKYDVWVMKEYGKKESWTKLFTFPSMQYDIPNPIWISDDDDEILTEHSLCLKVYDSKSGAFKEHLITNSGFSISAAAYAESLVSPNF